MIVKDLFSLDAYQFDFPPELIAQYPAQPRDSSRLMLVDRAKGTFEDRTFRDIADLLQPGDSLVLNNTKVIPARLIGTRGGGGKTEVLLVRPIAENQWIALAKPGKKLRQGEKVIFGDDFSCEITETLPDGAKTICFHFEGDFNALLQRYGRIPLPPYMQRQADDHDSHRYQTVFANKTGAVAAPTAGLHFTEQLLQDLSAKGVQQTCITLHVGIGTFRPVQTEDIRQHPMHTEWFEITAEAAQILSNRNASQRQVCVGTTCCRALEAIMSQKHSIQPGNYTTDIFIYPGYQFQYVHSLLTNFHTPGSSLLMLTCAFGGYDLIMEAYAKAVRDRYRFFSYGDAMLIV